MNGPDTTITAVNGNYAIDINGDGITDFNIQVNELNDVQGDFGNSNIISENNNQITLGSVSYCYSLNYATGNVDTVSANLMVNTYNINDSISKKCNWAPAHSLMTLEYAASSSFYPYSYNCGGSSGDTIITFIGVRIVKDSDTLYGWIAVSLDGKNFPDVTVISYACQKAITTGINEIKTGTAINIYPNPVRYNLNIEFPTEGRYNLSLTNVFGQVISSNQFYGVKTDLDVSGLSGGIYFVRVYNEHSEEVTKILVQ